MYWLNSFVSAEEIHLVEIALEPKFSLSADSVIRCHSSIQRRQEAFVELRSCPNHNDRAVLTRVFSPTAKLIQGLKRALNRSVLGTLLFFFDGPYLARPLQMVMQGGVRIPSDADQRSELMAITIPNSCRSPFQSDGDHRSKPMPITRRVG